MRVQIVVQTAHVAPPRGTAHRPSVCVRVLRESAKVKGRADTPREDSPGGEVTRVCAVWPRLPPVLSSQGELSRERQQVFIRVHRWGGFTVSLLDRFISGTKRS